MPALPPPGNPSACALVKCGAACTFDTGELPVGQSVASCIVFSFLQRPPGYPLPLALEGSSPMRMHSVLDKSGTKCAGSTWRASGLPGRAPPSRGSLLCRSCLPKPQAQGRPTRCRRWGTLAASTRNVLRRQRCIPWQQLCLDQLGHGCMWVLSPIVAPGHMQSSHAGTALPDALAARGIPLRSEEPSLYTTRAVLWPEQASRTGVCSTSCSCTT